MNKDYISIKEVMRRVMSHPMLTDIPMETAISYTLDLIQIVGSPGLFFQKEADLEIKDYRAMLPCDFYDMNQVIIADSMGSAAFKYSTDTFAPGKFGSGPERDLTYKLQGNVIYTSIPEGTIHISYRAIATDEDGYPLILNNAAFIRALESYIKMQWFTILFDQGKIQGAIMQKAEQDYYANVGQAQSALTMPSIDQMESLKNLMNSMLLHRYEHNNHFKDINKERTIKVH